MLFLLTVAVVIIIGMFMTNIMERRTEAQFLDQKKIEITSMEPRNEVWGINYPRQYNSYMKTADTTFHSKYNGAWKQDMLETFPDLVILWAGYGFAKDYRQGRGHVYAVEDIYNTLRTGAPIDKESGPMPATCWTCKSPDVPRLMVEKGATEFYSGKWAKWGGEVVNAIGCADCHDEKTMNLQITRPALIEAFERQGKDINDASHNEMRSLVCAQCHVEYYFNKKKPAEGVPYLTFPWDNGTSVEQVEEYYDNIEFKDWTHALSKAPMLKAQHPGYEIFQTGIHAKRGVSCADCHMPYNSEGGVKFTDHHIQSPLNNLANACQVCHREDSDELMANVTDHYDRVLDNRGKLEHLLVKLHLEAEYAWKLGATEEQMKDILMDIRHAQWRWDYAAASHGGAFHAPVETLRIIGTGIEIAQEGRIKLTKLFHELGFDGEVPMPDVSTKELAQQYIGLDMEKLNADKNNFKGTLLVEWLKAAEEREAKMPQYDQSNASEAVKASLQN
ncbi:MAG: ammonia-forming cytochrome c nitrite reductase [Schleiferiaceae bacterium]|nr:ammonia-forming cytochrome c nitrite reductase [Schleiferiaceae bacterium]